mmetsp:Transcript_34258/g.83231  ORF Transcript_34258/g.83231 Transcript_34258/m.83231 type:complete len:153 (-) Transcript_34258:295-753(-)
MSARSSRPTVTALAGATSGPVALSTAKVAQCVKPPHTACPGATPTPVRPAGAATALFAPTSRRVPTARRGVTRTPVASPCALDAASARAHPLLQEKSCANIRGLPPKWSISLVENPRVLVLLDEDCQGQPALQQGCSSATSKPGMLVSQLTR